MPDHKQSILGVLAWYMAVGVLVFASILPARASHVLLISVDGLRADVVTPELMPTLSSLREKGASTLEAESLWPTFTIPNHVSLCTGLTPETHEANFLASPGNDFVLPHDTIFELAHNAGRTTGIYLSKTKLGILAKPGTYDHLFVNNKRDSIETVSRFLEDVSAKKSRPELTLLHIIEPDAVGHSRGWMSDEYLESVTASDRYLADIVRTLEDVGAMDDTLIIVTADHGGIGFNHGERVPEVIRIPWIAFGAGVPRGLTITRRIGSHDAAPTVLKALGLSVPKVMEGTAVEEVFSDPRVLFLRGDCDGDGKVGGTTSEAIFLLRFAFLSGDTPPCLTACDATANGAIGVADAVRILRYSFLGGEPLEPPFPDCSLSSLPSDVALGCKSSPDGCE